MNLSLCLCLCLCLPLILPDSQGRRKKTTHQQGQERFFCLALPCVQFSYRRAFDGLFRDDIFCSLHFPSGPLPPISTAGWLNFGLQVKNGKSLRLLLLPPLLDTHHFHTSSPRQSCPADQRKHRKVASPSVVS